jgi:hydrogenase-1 operon protein HyaF
MAASLMSEIARRLASLALNGTEHAIDLHSLPLSDADRAELEQVLGRGEVQLELDIAGRSEIWETRYAGAWWIRHRGAGGRISSEEIAICRVPEILKSHSADIAESARRLAKENQA